MYWNDFENLSKAVGFRDPRVVESKVITVSNSRLEQKIEGYRFYSVTYRLFKMAGLEPHCEDYGQSVAYQGGVADFPNRFTLDGHHHFMKGKMELVCGNTYTMLKNSRLAPYFSFHGNKDTHFGIFRGCGVEMPYEESSEGVTAPQAAASSAAGCC